MTNNFKQNRENTFSEKVNSSVAASIPIDFFDKNQEFTVEFFRLLWKETFKFTYKFMSLVSKCHKFDTL